MQKLFTKYFFILFLIPLLVVIIFHFFGTAEITSFGVNRSVSFGLFDRILKNPIYNISAYWLSYALYLLSYFIVFLIRRKTNLIFSVLNFIMVLISFYLLNENPSNKILIPITMTGFIFFIFNIFKTKLQTQTFFYF